MARPRRTAATPHDGQQARGGVPLAGAGLLAAALLMAACDKGADGAAPPFHPVATVADVMDGIVIPSADAVFDAVVYDNGALVATPASDDDWHTLRMHALAVAEAGNLLMMAPRARDGGEWMTWSRAMIDGAVRVAEAIDARDTDRLLETGSAMYEACTGCHERYLDGP